MLWWIPIIALTLMLAFVSTCRMSGRCAIESAPAPTLKRGLRTYRELLCEIERDTTQARARLAMLDEMIEKSDRAIEDCQAQLAELRVRRAERIDPDERRMLDILDDCGFPADELAKLTARPINQVRRAA